jgi:hypothetical protein
VPRVFATDLHPDPHEWAGSPPRRGSHIGVFHPPAAGNAFANVSPDKGRIHTSLLAAPRNFLINEWKRETTLKRGGAVRIVDLDSLDPSVSDACELHSGENLELAFDRQWTLAVIGKVRQRLHREYEGADHSGRHQVLMPGWIGIVVLLRRHRVF